MTAPDRFDHAVSGRGCARRGTILILIAGISALLLSLAAAFLARMRSDGEEMASVLREAQAHIMLLAACNYLQEASRIGWESPAQGGTPSPHEETFGWIDVRDGKLGPKVLPDFSPGGAGDDSRFPVGQARRFPMYVMERPPFATQLTAAYNPIRTPVSPNPVSDSDVQFGMPLLTNPDPQPVVANGWNVSDLGAGVSPSRPFTDRDGAQRQAWDAYVQGIKRPRQNSTGMSWFRIFRDGPATFVITCGGGGTMGFRTWDEVLHDPNDGHDKRAVFSEDRATFDGLLAEECRLFYRVEWNAACATMEYQMLYHEVARDYEHYAIWPPNASHTEGVSVYRSQTHAVNMGGTMLWIQRMRNEPTTW